jgi:hypothetical protein
MDRLEARTSLAVFPHADGSRVPSNTDLRKFLLMSVAFFLGHGPIAGAAYRTDEAGAQATAQSERTRLLLVANRFHAISQASMMSAKPRNTELASQWLRRSCQIRSTGLSSGL